MRDITTGGKRSCTQRYVARHPATTDADRVSVAAALGMTDGWPVVTKRLSQWVIEDTYGARRPDWDASGATFMTGVVPFEWAKLRILNSAHSALAVLGYLAGYETVAETVADAMATPDLTELARGLMLDEAAPTLPRLSGLGVAGYTQSQLNRFRNPALYHRPGKSRQTARKNYRSECRTGWRSGPRSDG